MTPDLLYQAFAREIQYPDPDIDLARAALQIARFEYPRLAIEPYLHRLDRMAEEVRERLPATRYPLKVIQTINEYLFEELQFSGNTQDYYDPGNSYLNDVIDRRTGIPLTLSIVYLEIAKRLDFPMVGVGLPGHFIIRPNFDEVAIFVDPFHRGEILFEEDCQERLSQIYQQPVKLEAHFLATVTNHQILVRMLTNLKYIFLNRQRWEKTIQTIDLLLLLIPNHPIELRDRGLLFYRSGQLDRAKQDLGFYLALLPDARDADTIRQLLQEIG
ncbi:transglutaminase-like domain-containing protein [Pannus brasiliensis CCIBt3594]|uniref:Transglutaminase-like domain-containing protein n=1 Tax=Pannus brasiliensis CCIBt3594 TaxID=1427578 RepID=A0AAW9QNC3_9CHRO